MRRRRWLGKIVVGLAVVIFGIVSAGVRAQTPAGGGFTEALTGGKVSADIRYRFAFITQDNDLKDAKASTVRTRLGYRTKDYSGIGAFVQLSDTRVVAVGDYNSTVNHQTQYSVEADPKLTQVSQAYLDLTAAPGSRLRVGRQRLIFDNARFVGNVGWRQNQQTFDAASFTDTLGGKLHATYAYLYNVNTVTGGDVGVHAHLLNAGYGFGALKAVAYGYLISFDDTPANSSKTFGLRLKGQKRLARLKGKLIYTAEYANQSPYRGGNPGLGANYYLGEAGIALSDKTLKVSYEVLGGGDYSGFETPLATKHAFNGWADQFLSTPRKGLRDLFFTVGLHPPNYRILAIYHRFSAQRGGAHYGDELDLQLAKRFGPHYALLAEYARYRADTYSINTDKFWVQGVVRF